ncbi:Transient receptor potential cation channel subfamily A member 1 [Trichoplax sp. H2]|nr:Transient receptor potential cation channel subfamily A member 1 [Trichoplax sp. H2]|eukprot:RDD41717.1 Transient receptor potential cation channel subfamily A member 1 [Trichoplax sp. H2]
MLNMRKGSKIQAFDHKNEDEPNCNDVVRSGSSRRKFSNCKSKKNLTRSSAIENGTKNMLIDVKEQHVKSKTATDFAVNSSLVSLGFAASNSKAQDLLKAIKLGSLEEIQNLLTLNRYDCNKINSVDEENLFTFMHYAARYDRSDAVGCLIDFGADVNSKGGKDGITPLHITAQFNGTSAAQTLIQFGAIVSANSKTKENPLHYCCKYGNDKVAEIIVREAERLNMTGKIVNQPDNESHCPIHLAALHNNNTKIINILLKHGASIVKKNLTGRLPSHFAAEHKDTAILEYLLQHAKIKGLNDYVVMSNSDRGTALHIAADVGSVVAAEICFKYGAEIEAQTYELLTPLHIAAKNGNYEFAEYLINKGAKVSSKDNEGRTCLHYAALCNNISLTELMIYQGADIEARDTTGQTPLLLAIGRGHTSVFKILVELGADITATDFDGRHCIHYIIEQNDISTIQAVLENGGKELVNRPDNKGVVPSRIAAMKGTIAALYYLHENGASLNSLDEEGNTLLHVAAKGNHRDTVKLILEATKAKDVNTKNTFGQKPIHIAAKYGHNRVIQNMIRNGADINSRDNYFYYPLHYAAEGGFTAAIQLLVDKNARICVLDRSKNTALHLASANGHQEVVKILLANGADPTAINSQGLNCLDVAIENDQTEIGLQIIRSEYWEKALENREFDGHTPMKRLIKKLPIVASAVMDRCITYTTDIGDCNEEQVIFNFSYLETPPCQIRYKNVKDDFLAVSTILSYNRIKLMKHPLIWAYRHYKWKSVLRYFYYGGCFINLVFLLAICIPIGLNISDYYEALRNKTGNNAVLTVAVTQYSEAIHTRNIITFSAVVFNVFINLIRLLLTPRKLIAEFAASALEIGIELISLVYCIPFQRPITNLLVQIGALIMFLSIINFLVWLKRAFGIGIYLTMFFTIMKTIIRASLVIILFLIAFATACYMVLRQLPEFSEFGYAFMRVLTMMVGDISYREVFLHLHDTNQLQYSGLALTIIVLFVVVINIAFANLLVGLAVGDINEVRSNADISLIKMDLSYINNFKTCYWPKRLQKYVYQPVFIIRKHQKMSLREKFIWEQLTAGITLQAPAENTEEICTNISIFQELRQQHLEIKDLTDKFIDFRSDIFYHLSVIKRLQEKMNAADISNI